MRTFNIGDEITWIKRNTIVPHPEGKTDRDGNILPVFRDLQIKGKVVGSSGRDAIWARPNTININNIKMYGEKYYDTRISIEDIL